MRFQNNNPSNNKPWNKGDSSYWIPYKLLQCKAPSWFIYLGEYYSAYRTQGSPKEPESMLVLGTYPGYVTSTEKS